MTDEERYCEELTKGTRPEKGTTRVSGYFHKYDFPLGDTLTIKDGVITVKEDRDIGLDLAPVLDETTTLFGVDDCLTMETDFWLLRYVFLKPPPYECDGYVIYSSTYMSACSLVHRLALCSPFFYTTYLSCQQV
jgi:hypothetical protein